MNVLLATDGSRYAEWAVELLLRFPLPAGTEITVLTAVPWATVEWPNGEAVSSERQEAITTMRKANEAVADELLERIRKALAPRWRDVGTWIKYGTPSAEIVEAAEAMGADLVVLGAKGLSGIKRFLLGSVAQKVVRYAPCSVLVVKRRPEILRKILVTLDRSAYASTVVSLLEELPWPRRTEITLLSVVERRRYFAAGVSLNARVELKKTLDELYRTEREALERVQVKAANRLQQKVQKVEMEIRGGHPSEEILRVAQAGGFDLVVVGSKGLTGVKRFLLGSVSQKIVKYAPCSVLVVRP